MINYAGKIKKYRECIFLTQSQLVNILGCKFMTISRWEAGRFEQNMVMKKKLVGIFRKSGMKIDVD